MGRVFRHAALRVFPHELLYKAGIPSILFCLAAPVLWYASAVNALLGSMVLLSIGAK